MRARLTTALIALLFGALGMGLWVVGIHLYQDHQSLHALVQLEVQRQQTQQKQNADILPAPSK